MSLEPNDMPVFRSASEVAGSVQVVHHGSWLRKFLSFAGPGYMVSVGYMDPGNWATDLAGGSKFGYALLWVVLLSNLIAMLLQSLCVRLGLVTGRDLAQACRDHYKRPAAIALWVLCEIAIIACDLAEVVGSAIALNLLFGIPLVWGVVITGFDVLLLMGLMRFGFRMLEAVVIAMVSTVGLCFAFEMLASKPDLAQVATGLVPSMPGPQALLISLGILGATVMPHNLYLHSSIVKSRAHLPTAEGLRAAVHYSTVDVIVALGAAFFVNASILILAAAVFHRSGIVVTELQQAHSLLNPLLGGAAATVFAVALLASGQSATITGTLAGQIVMEGFLNWRMTPWIRRLATRLLAIVPAIALVAASDGKNTVQLLVISQVVLSMQLSFAIFPLMAFTSDKRTMGEYANRTWIKMLGYTACVSIALLNAWLVLETIGPVWTAGVASLVLGFSGWVKWFYRPKSPAS